MGKIKNFNRWRRRMGLSDVLFCHFLSITLGVFLISVGGKTLLLHIESVDAEAVVIRKKDQEESFYEYKVGGKSYTVSMGSRSMPSGERLPIRYHPWWPSFSQVAFIPWQRHRDGVLIALIALTFLPQLFVLIFRDRRRYRRLQASGEQVREGEN